jgi:hypothetical protein
MSYENTAGIQVNNQYGPRNTGGAIGLEQTQDSVMTFSYDLTGEMLNSGFVPKVKVPKRALLRKAYLIVDEVFVVSAAGTVAIGGTAPGTNGVVLTEAKLEALGVSDVSALAIGTWATASATGTTGAELITKAITGTVGATSGKGTLVMEFEAKSVS